MANRTDNQTIEVPSAESATAYPGPTTLRDRLGEAVWLGGDETVEQKELRAHAADYAEGLAAAILASPQMAQMVPGQMRPQGVGQPQIEIGTQDPGSGYIYLDCLTVGPLQPPFPLGPRRLVASGDPVVFLGFVLINPLPLGGVPATTDLGARDFRISFQLWNKTTNATTNAVANGTFPNTAPVITPVLFIPPTPPPAPATGLDVNEMCLTIDVGPGGQPYAAFNTWHFDPFGSTGLFLPPEPPGFQQMPARYGVYDPTA